MTKVNWCSLLLIPQICDKTRFGLHILQAVAALLRSRTVLSFVVFDAGEEGSRAFAVAEGGCAGFGDLVGRRHVVYVVGVDVVDIVDVVVG